MYLLFEVGGTKTRIGFSQDNQNITGSQIIPSSQEFEDFVQKLRKLSPGKIDGVSGGLPGVLNEERSLLLASPHLPGWVSKPVKEILSDSFQASVFLENDAALGALGEAVKGAGVGHSIVSYVTIGTGIGGARVVDGKIDKKVLGFEPGHQIIDLGGVEFEQYISGTALAKEFGKPSDQIEDPKVWDEAARRLAIGLNNIILLWSPNILILGGGLMQRISIGRIRFHLSQTVKLFPKLPEIAASRLGELAGIHGSLEYLKQNIT